MDKPVVATLSQRFPVGRRQELQLTEDEVRIHSTSLLAEAFRTVPLEVLDRNETEMRTYPGWTRAATAAAATGALLAALWGVRLAPLWWPASSLPALWGAAAAFGAALAAAALHLLLSRDSILFFHSFTSEFLFSVRRDAPDRGTVSAFVTQIKERAKRRYEQLRADAERPSIARELLALKELCEKKVITAEELATKKEELLDEIMRD